MYMCTWYCLLGLALATSDKAKTAERGRKVRESESYQRKQGGDEEEITFKTKSERLLSLIHASSLSEYSMHDR